MSGDIRVSTAFPRNPKTVRLWRRLNEAGVLALIYLWLWVGDNRPDGDLGGMATEDIEIVAEWHGEPGALVSALVGLHYLDGKDGSYRIHDWAACQPWVTSHATRTEAARKAANERWRSKTPEQRSEAARHAAKAKWDLRALRMHDASTSDEEGTQQHASRTDDACGMRAPYPTQPSPTLPNQGEALPAVPSNGESAPEALHPLQYASGILEQAAIPCTPSLTHVCAAALKALSTKASLPIEKAAASMLERVRGAIAKGVKVDRWYFEDSKWDTPADRPAPTRNVLDEVRKARGEMRFGQ